MVAALWILAFALAADAFAVAVAQGASHRPRFAEAIRIGAAFGIAQGVMPLIGWVIGASAATWLAAIDHWVVLVLLGGLGIRMIREGLSNGEGIAPRMGGKALLIAAIATSIDAAVAGVTLPTIGAPLALSCLVIGLVTAVLSFAGVWLGAMIGARVGPWAEVGGGVLLAGLGVKIFLEHTMGG